MLLKVSNRLLRFQSLPKTVRLNEPIPGITLPPEDSLALCSLGREVQGTDRNDKGQRAQLKSWGAGWLVASWPL